MWQPHRPQRRLVIIPRPLLPFDKLLLGSQQTAMFRLVEHSGPASVPPGRAADDVVFVFQPVVPARYACFSTGYRPCSLPGA